MTIESNPEETAVIDSSLKVTALESTILQDEVQTISDKAKMSTQSLIQKQTKENEEKVKLLKELLTMEVKIHNNAAKDIVRLPSLISRNGIPIIKQGTVNILQGKTGTHKTRFSELLISLLIDKANGNYLHFQKEIEKPVVVCYIDTERNTTEELPLGVQNIKLKAGYRRDEKIPTLRCTSIKHIDRDKRLKAVECFISKVRNQNPDSPIFTVLDVVTDCCANFNNVDETLKLFDFISRLCEQYQVTFFLVIHENPFSDKARGHLGTEASNKASAMLSIGFEKVNDKEVNLMCLKFLKLRGASRPTPIYMSYNEDSDQLELASNDAISRMLAEKEQTTNVDSVAELIGQTMVENREYTQQEILNALKVKYKWADNTLKKHLKTIADSERELININSEPCLLDVKASSGKETTYRLIAVNVTTSFETKVLNTEKI